MKYKRFISMLLAFCCVASFVACGDEQGSGNGGNGENPFEGGTVTKLEDYEISDSNNDSVIVRPTLPDDEWKSKPGYNYFAYPQLGADVMPIGGWVAPPTNCTAGAGTFETNQVTLENYRNIKLAGLNSIYGLYDALHAATDRTNVLNALDYANEVGIVYLVRDHSIMGALALEGVDAYSLYEEYMTKPAFGGCLFVDEPGYTDFQTIADATSAWKQLPMGKDTNPLVNMLPMGASASQLYYGAGNGNLNPPVNYKGDKGYKEWTDTYIEMVDPPVYSYDMYPLTNNSYNGGFNGYYYTNLAIVRQSTLEANKPFWVFAQMGRWNTSTIFDYEKISWQIHTPLAFGAKGIQWFCYWHALDFSGNAVGGFVDHYGNKTPYFDYGQRINRHIAAVDEVLMKCASKGVIQLGSLMGGTIPSYAMVSNGKYAALTSAKNTAGNAIVGCFEYRDQGWAYYVANNHVSEPATVMLNFDTSYDITTIQESISSETNASTLTVELAAGDGALVVVHKNQ